MTNCDDIDDVDEGDSAYATTTTAEYIQYIETTDDMATLSHGPKHVWTKEEEGTLGGRFAKTFVDVGSNESVGYEGFDMPDGNKDFPSVYNQGIDMSEEDVRTSRPSHASKGKADQANRRGRGEASERARLKSYI
ncbi:retrotransposon protein [Cucumis melo var. makuwa]|uniref:Retrotransposon protein n=1 Tax=Cucumis melo var. makuwa TaxID=1194695 RepID=A0A5D3DFC3_CUCMM|nr:retrotransposon protein [Cucumis melo var. makuwa]